MKFDKWLDTFIDEKELDTDTLFEIEADDGLHMVDFDLLITWIKTELSSSDQNKVKDQLVRIDFANGDVMDFFEYIAAWFTGG